MRNRCCVWYLSEQTGLAGPRRLPGVTPGFSGLLHGEPRGSLLYGRAGHRFIVASMASRWRGRALAEVARPALPVRCAARPGGGAATGFLVIVPDPGYCPSTAAIDPLPGHPAGTKKPTPGHYWRRRLPPTAGLRNLVAGLALRALLRRRLG